MDKIALIQDPLFLEHLSGISHPERPDRLKAISTMLKNSGLEKQCLKLETRSATKEEILSVHTSMVYERAQNTQGKELDYLDADTPTTAHSFEAALLAAGSVIQATDYLLQGKIEQAFCFPRPPGHHAEAHRSMGFCLFNNVAIAAQYAIEKFALKKVAIYDFDVHHGNGTQHIFERRSDVFFASIHQYPFYPGTGAASEKGLGGGEGYTLNIPMAAGSTDAIYAEEIQNKMEPALLDFKPELLIISAGFDAHQRDPLGGMALTKDAFKRMAEGISKLKKQCGSIPVLYSLEGGYDLQGLSESVKEVLEVMIKN